MLPAAGWRQSGRDDDPDDVLSRRQLAKMQQFKAEKELVEIIGPYYVGTITLVRYGHEMLTAHDRHGHAIRWSIWAPVKGMLIDIFRYKLPRSEELEDRAAFAQQHGLKYGIVEPGKRLSLDQLKEWVAA